MNWSSRTCTPADDDLLMGFFAEPDFYFNTPHPQLLGEDEVHQRVADARLLFCDGEAVGLYAVRSFGGQHCHYALQLRLAADRPDKQWLEAYRQIVRAMRWRTEVVRVTQWAGEPDTRGLRVLRSAGLVEEGVLPGLVAYRGRRYGLYQFAAVWR